jgi:hypothetical protein
MRFRIPSLMLAAAFGLAMTAGAATTAVAKGGRGHGHGMKVGHYKVHKLHHTPRGWSRGRKVGWRGPGCPPGLWRQGRC